MSGLFEDGEAALVFDDLLPDEGALGQGEGAPGTDKADGDGPVLSAAEQAEADLKAAAAALRPRKRRRAPFNETHMASRRGLGLLHAMSCESLRGANPPIRIRTSRGREAEGMAACATLWRAWAQASYPGMTLADMLPRLAVMSGKGQIKASAAAMREADAQLVEAQRDRVRVEGGTPSKRSPDVAAEGPALSTPSTATPALTSPPPASAGAPPARATAPASVHDGAGVGQDLIEEAEAAMREQAGVGAGRSSAAAEQSAPRRFDAAAAAATAATAAAAAAAADDDDDDIAEEEEEDYGALGVNLDDF